MLTLVSLVVSVLATLIGQIVLYKEFPKQLRPSPLSIAVLGACVVFYGYIIVRALASFFGKS